MLGLSEREGDQLLLVLSLSLGILWWTGWSGESSMDGAMSVSCLCGLEAVSAGKEGSGISDLHTSQPHSDSSDRHAGRRVFNMN